MIAELLVKQKNESHQEKFRNFSHTTLGVSAFNYAKTWDPLRERFENKRTIKHTRNRSM